MGYEGIVCLCSRGLVQSRTVEAIWRNLTGRRDRWEIVFSHNKGIPDAQIFVTESALRLDPEFILYVEEDNVPAFHALPDMLEASGEFPVVTLDYRLDTGEGAVQRDGSGKFLFAGMGCMLVRAKVFEKIKKPWFDTLSFTKEGGILNSKTGYGGQDVFFWKRILEAGIPVKVLDLECFHLKVAEYGDPGKNDGVHKIKKL